MTNAWVATCVPGIFQINVAFAPGKKKNTPSMGTYVFVTETPQKGKEQTHILEFICLHFLVLHPDIVVISVIEHHLMLGSRATAL